MRYLSTKELKSYVDDLYEKIRDIAEKDEVYEPLTIHFATGTPRNQPGDYCYSDKDGYHFCGIGDGGETIPEKVTNSLFEISYMIVEHKIWLMSSKFKTRNKIQGQDFRRIMFEKELQYFEILGDEYKQKAEDEINEVLKKHPFEDDDILSQSLCDEATNKLIYSLETNGSRFEDRYISETLMEDYLDHFTSAYWDFMTLVPSIPIKGSSFIQVGSPDAKTNYKMTVEIGFPSSDGVELYRYYTTNKEEVLQIFKDYYLKQEIPDYKKWENVSSELKPRKPRRFL